MHKRTFIFVFAGLEAVIFSIIIFMAMIGVTFFQPEFVIDPAGLRKVQELAVLSAVQTNIVFVICGIAHQWAQRHLNANPSVIVTWEFKVFDVVTSLLPIASLIAAYLVASYMAPATGYASWWNWTRGLYALIVVWASVEDIIHLTQGWAPTGGSTPAATSAPQNTASHGH